ncbi:class I SAM-dependent methyltransferase [Chloroflexota bacterium]
MKTFPSEHYDEDYFAGLGPGSFRHFVESKGRSLADGRLRYLDMVKLQPGMKLLDIGCSRGELVMFCGSKGIDSYGIDYSQKGLEIGMKYLNFYNEDELMNIHLLQSDATCLPFKDTYFDRVISFAVLEHLYPWQQEKCFHEIHRVLKPDGVFVLETHPNEWFERIGYRITKPFKQLFIERRLENYRERKVLDPGHVNLKNHISLRRDLQRSGFCCKVWLPRRANFEANVGIAKYVSLCLEAIPGVNMIFRNSIYGIAAKSKQSLRSFQSLSVDRFYQ